VGRRSAASREREGPDKEEAREKIEVFYRFMMSLMLSPAPQRAGDELRAFLRRTLVPSLGLEPGEQASTRGQHPAAISCADTRSLRLQREIR